jgi:signal transduction histidine kinase
VAEIKVEGGLDFHLSDDENHKLPEKEKGAIVETTSTIATARSMKPHSSDEADITAPAPSVPIATSPLDEMKILQEIRILFDILVHDVQNYNQIALISAEVISDFNRDDEDFQNQVKQLKAAINGSSLLLKRASRLGNVLSQQNAKLFPVDAGVVIKKSLDLIRRATTERKTIEISNLPLEASAFVMADDLLDEVFTNIFSNCVKYTEASSVRIEISVLDGDRPGFWKISIADHGRGVPDEVKSNIFTRFQKSAKGSGLGLSIVHSLVVDRYHGEVTLRNRVDGDYTQGILVEIFLPKPA